MANEIIIVGAGPIGLWLAIQIKLLIPDATIIIKEKYDSYQRGHTLFLKADAFKDRASTNIEQAERIVEQLKQNPNIRTNSLQQQLHQVALELGIRIEQENIADVKTQIQDEYPNALIIIGADGVRSTVHQQLFPADNTVREALSYSAQIKYEVEGSATRADYATMYSLLKQSHFIATANVGKMKDGKTPVTIQFIIDEQAYRELKDNGEEKSQASFRNPLRIFKSAVGHIPENLYEDISLQLGHRLAQDENILVDSIKLTTTELPQQRRKQAVRLDGGSYYSCTGDALLALSFFRGMNAGLPLATRFARAISENWSRLLRREPNALAAYESHYRQYAKEQFKKGRSKKSQIESAGSVLNVLIHHPLQLIYYSATDIERFHKQFAIMQMASQYFLDILPEDVRQHANAQAILKMLGQQIPQGIPILQQNLAKLNPRYAHHPELRACIKTLLDYRHEIKDLYSQAIYGIALSKTRILLETPSCENCEDFLKFIGDFKVHKSNLYTTLSSIFETVIGIIAIGIGIACFASWITVASPILVGTLSLSCGSILTCHGLFKLVNNTRNNAPEYWQQLEAIPSHGLQPIV